MIGGKSDSERTGNLRRTGSSESAIVSNRIHDRQCAVRHLLWVALRSDGQILAPFHLKDRGSYKIKNCGEFDHMAIPTVAITGDNCPGV
jgi:hypothetical protein